MSNKLIGIYKKAKESVEHKKVIKNFGFLSVIQIGNYILPLITLPYLVNVLEADAFGQIMFAQAFVQYFVLIIDYGFNFSATREISLNRKNEAEVSRIFCAVMTIKICLFFASLIIFTLLLVALPKFASFKEIYFLTFAATIGNVLFPVWLFQGIEKMKYITVVNVGSKLISTVMIVLIVKRSEHVLLVPMINALAVILPSAILLCCLKKIYPIKIIAPSLNDVFSELRNGWHVFLSSISSSLYSTTNTFLLGFLFNNTYAGYYAFAEKIIRACTSFLSPLNGALFPYMSLKIKEDKSEAMGIFKMVLVGVVLIMSIGSIALYVSSDYIVNIINSSFSPSIPIIKILSPLLVIVAVSNLIGFQILYTMGQESKFLISVFVAGIFNLLFCFVLSHLWHFKAAAVSLLIAESFICLSFVYYSRKNLFISV